MDEIPLKSIQKHPGTSLKLYLGPWLKHPTKKPCNLLPKVRKF